MKLIYDQRWFKRTPMIPVYGGEIEVAESSLAEVPAILLTIQNDRDHWKSITLTVDEAMTLIEALTAIANNHYQRMENP